ncbi:MAG: alpha/beta fold hydrolase [Flavitalea sp.]
MILPITSFKWVCVSLLIFAFVACKKDMGTPTPVDTNLLVEGNAADLIPVTVQVNASFGGFYIQLPHLYKYTTKNYPILIFFHGLGQMGNGSSDLGYILQDGIGKVLNDKKFPISFDVQGKNYSFIIVSPQTSKIPSMAEAWQFVQYIMSNYRGDPKRLYISGLSLGSRIATLVAAQYPDSVAALLAIAGVALNPGFEGRCTKIANANLPVWEFHNIDDPLANVNDAKRFIKLISDLNPPVSPRMTIFDVYGHDAWTTALNPNYKENSMNVYEWMLHYSR